LVIPGLREAQNPESVSMPAMTPIPGSGLRPAPE